MPNPILAFALGFFSHFVLDRIPHIDPDLDTTTEKNFQFTKPVIQTMIIAIIDTSIVAGLALYLTTVPSINPVNTICGMAGSILPDYLVGFSVLIKNTYLKKFEKFHQLCHFDEKKLPIPWYAGSLTQITLLIASMYLLVS